MSDRVVARAPGKLFVLGEYAVLDGGPAVVAAVDRYIEATLTESASDTVQVVAPGHAATAEFHVGDPPPSKGPLSFAFAAYRAAASRLPYIARTAMRIEIVSHLADADGVKAGLGSSAAVTVAVVGALFAAAGCDPTAERDAVFAAAFEAHRDAQGGVGSGADVAASVYGGLVLFQPRNGHLPQVVPRALPPGTTLLAAWSGAPASTVGLVQRYLAMDNGRHAARLKFVQSSRACVDGFVDALSRGTLALASIDANGAVLDELGSVLEQPLLTPPLRQLVAIARAHGAAAKISGAGAGDCGIALTRDASVADRIRTAWRAAGLTPLDIHISTGGVTYGRC